MQGRHLNKIASKAALEQIKGLKEWIEDDNDISLGSEISTVLSVKRRAGRARAFDDKLMTVVKAFSPGAYLFGLGANLACHLWPHPSGFTCQSKDLTLCCA